MKVLISTFLFSSILMSQVIEMPAEVLRDKIRGGLLGQILGNLNGLPHEMKYIDQPGNVKEYIPALLDGARTDDDTDFEWVYLYVMQEFISETFGLLAPAMPQTASRIGLNYTRITIDMEPAQTTQFFCSMISTAFITDDMEKILGAGTRALDTSSYIREIVNDVKKWHKLYPDEWATTRQLVKEKYSHYDGKMRDKNGFELNTASTIAALLYGEGDFSKTLMTAFNFGWDADNTAATAGTIMGVVKGHKWMMSQGWKIVDRYKNTKRENMPDNETITSFADRIIDLSERVITNNGGERVVIDGTPVYKIVEEKPRNVQKLPNIDSQISNLKKELGKEVIQHIKESNEQQELARAAYLAICLEMAPSLQKQYPERWSLALDALTGYWRVMQNIFYDDEIPGILPLRKKALAAGLKKPSEKRDVW